MRRLVPCAQHARHTKTNKSCKHEGSSVYYDKRAKWSVGRTLSVAKCTAECVHQKESKLELRALLQSLEGLSKMCVRKLHAAHHCSGVHHVMTHELVFPRLHPYKLTQ